MDESTVTGDNMSVFTVPYKDSRPSTPSQMPPNPRLPGLPSRSESPLRTASPIGRKDDYFARAPSRGTYRGADMKPGNNSAYAPSEASYELNPLSRRNYDLHEMTDSMSLLQHDQGHPKSQPPSGKDGYL
jgi:hypothetical protein